MSITNNIYRRALEIGHEHLDNGGISYNEMVSKLDAEIPHEKSFINWFFYNFRSDNSEGRNAVENMAVGHYAVGHFHDNLNDKSFLSPEGVMKLMEFIELEEARQSSLKASRHARIAIYISIGTLIIGVVFNIISLTSDNNPKVEVDKEIDFDTPKRDHLCNQDTIYIIQPTAVEDTAGL